ncbi:hypothetical protein ACIBTZ_05255 [Micromonospora sp. NPDC049460]|uniref:hypothetical protein n=1 Tax=Micromonospora sp. NPDC049460 TaxID=3364272 RepID=UPI00378A3105
MIVASLLLILVAVVLLVAGLAGGSSVLLVVSIAASLLAAVALVVGARQAAGDRLAAERPSRTDRRSRTATRRADAAFAYGPPVEPEIPVQHVPPTVDAGGTGWRQPPEPPVADVGSRGAAPGAVGAYDDEPAAQDVTPADAARVARLDAEVRVVDGRPRYHLTGCAHLVGREHESLPVGEAVELGFTPCADCAPDTALLADAGRL